MKKLLSILLIAMLSQLQIAYALAGSDGNLELSKKNENTAEVKDCFETINRGIFAFNQALDNVFFKPVAKGYRFLPKPIRSGTSNALNNLTNVVTIPNNVLQGQLKDAGVNSLRFVINSTLGIVGIFDVASSFGLTKRNKEDYGQTLGAWGFREGCYFVLPVLGPTTVRDSIGSLANISGGDAWYNVTVKNNTQYFEDADYYICLLYTSPSPRDKRQSRMPSSA